MTKVFKKLNRMIVSPIFFGLKADRIIRNFSHNSIINLMYHGVVEKDSTYFSPRHMTIKQFERHLKYYRKEFDIITISDAFSYYRNGYKPKRKAITVSFDDGYSNNLYNALPLLEKYSIPTTIFVSGICTKDMRVRALWSDLIDCLKYFNHDEIIELDGNIFRNFKHVDHKMTINDFMKTCTVENRNRYLNDLVERYHLDNKLNSIPSEIWQILDKEQLIKLASSAVVEIGSHGHTHLNLAEIKKEEAVFELQHSKLSLENVINKEVNSLAYPDGNYNNELKNISEALGYKFQLAVNYLHDADWSDKRILNRFGISSTTTFEANVLLLNNAFRGHGFKTYS